MKIAFCGAGGTGKSTTAKLVAEATGLPLIPSPSRMCFLKHGVATEDEQNDMTPEARYRLQFDIFHAIKDLYTEHKDGVFDRTLLDNFNYLMFRCHDIVQQDEIEFCDDVTHYSLMDPDVKLFYFPLYNWKIEEDGMRTMKPAPRFMADYCIRGYLDKYKIPHFRMENFSIGRRVDSILEVCGYAHG